MSKPRILVLTAAGRTGMPVALQLLDEGFPVTAFVHQADQRSECFKAKGADIVVGSLTDINDMRSHRICQEADEGVRGGVHATAHTFVGS